MTFVDRTPTERLRYAQIMPLMTALNALVQDGPTPECRAQALALSTCRVLLPPSNATPTEAHEAYVGVLRGLLAVPPDCWPDEARTIRAAAEGLMRLTLT